MNYKIGVGVTTTPNRQLHKNIYDLTAKDAVIVVNNDIDGEGVSKSRNNCIKHLYDAGCDFIFLFDDDCYPMHPGWEKYFIECHLKSGIHHFGIPEAFKSELLSTNGTINYYNGAIGCFRFMTRQMIETVGYFNTAYNRYGFEDSAYSIRALKSGLYGNQKGKFPSPARAVSYIFSEDVYALNPPPNIVMEEKLKYIEENRPKYLEEISADKIYYPYEQ